MVRTQPHRESQAERQLANQHYRIFLRFFKEPAPCPQIALGTAVSVTFLVLLDLSGQLAKANGTYVA